MTEGPKLYLATPQHIDLSSFPDQLCAVLDQTEIACLRLALSSRDEDELARSADALRELAHARDVPLVIDNHHRLAGRLGLDGVHLTDGHRRLREIRKALGADAIVGAFCGISRHDGMTAGEIGADYVAFGPLTASDLIGDGAVADPELFDWWSETVEVPVVAEGRITPQILARIGPHADFICLSDEIWGAGDGTAPVKALRDLMSALD